jgi:DNA-nicking Smr family endonuclease
MAPAGRHRRRCERLMSGKPPKNINSEDSALFRAAAAGARPVTTRRLGLRRSPPGAHARFRRRDEDAVLQESLRLVPEALELESGEELTFRRASIPESVLRNLRRGRYAIRGEIVLHGMTGDEAHAQLRTFLAESVTARVQCVRVVHGKGLRSGPRGPVLKASVNRWLRQWDDVLAFVSAPARDGGTGALYVLLRR